MRLPPVFTYRCVNGEWLIEAPQQDHLQAPFRASAAPLVDTEAKIQRSVDDLLEQALEVQVRNMWRERRGQ